MVLFVLLKFTDLQCSLYMRLWFLVSEVNSFDVDSDCLRQVLVRAKNNVCCLPKRSLSASKDFGWCKAFGTLRLAFTSTDLIAINFNWAESNLILGNGSVSLPLVFFLQSSCLNQKLLEARIFKFALPISRTAFSFSVHVYNFNFLFQIYKNH